MASQRPIKQKQKQKPKQEVAPLPNEGPSVDLVDLRFIDIGVNLTDGVFRGRSRHGSSSHPDDLNAVLQRSKDAGLKSMIITGGSLKESREAIKLAKEYGMYATTGCHPTRSKEFESFGGGPEAYLAALDKLIEQTNKSRSGASTATAGGPGRVVAYGECGLDYDRLHFSPAETQRKYFRMQLGLAKKHHLPLFLHSRAAHADFVQILKEEGYGEDGGRAVGGRGGVVHSYTGGKEELQELLEMGLYISVNGCGMKTPANLEATAEIPLDRLMLETDAPWCSMTSTHASAGHLKAMPKDLKGVVFPESSKNWEEGKMVKGRNEPNAIGGVAWVVAQVKGVSVKEVIDAAWKNTVDVFGLEEDGLVIKVAADGAVGASDNSGSAVASSFVVKKSAPPPPRLGDADAFPALR